MIAYLITNKTNGRQYVGITTKPLARRWATHKAAAVSGSENALHRAIRKYGVENFSVVCIASVFSPEGLREVERILIQQHRTRSPLGYNMTDGGDGTRGFTHSLEARKKIGDACRGRIVSGQTRERLRLAHTGKTLTDEHRHKLSARKTGKKLPPRSRDHCERISAGLRAAHARRRAVA